MDDSQESLLTVATEIRELLKLLAEPAIALRDEKLRSALRQVVGRSAAKQQAVLLMDGKRTQSDIRHQVKIDGGDLSKLVKALREQNLLFPGDQAKLRIPIPKSFFEIGDDQ